MVTSKSRWYALVALALSTLAVGLDTTVLSVALPTLAHDLHATTGDLQWITTSYLLVLAAALLPAGMLGDRLGRKKMLIGGLAMFGLASVACSYAQGAGQLIAARAVLGLGAAVIMTMSGAVLTVLFEPKERGRAMGVWVTASALGIPLGPLLGGWLLDNFWWGSVFLINVPVVVAGIIALTAWLPESHGERGGRLDLAGIVTSAAGLVALTYGIIEAGDRGWGDARSLITVVAGVLLLGGFVWWQRLSKAPLIDLKLFQNRAFTSGAVLATIASFALLGLLFSLPQFFSAIGGHDAFGSGLRLLPVIAGLVVGARLGERVARRTGARPVIAAGLVAIAVGSFVGALTTTSSSYGFVAVWISVAGLGLGLTVPVSLNVAMSALTARRSGVGNAVLQTLRQVGGAVGVAVLGTVLNSGYRDHLPAGAPAAAREGISAGLTVSDPGLLDAVRDAFVHGMDLSLVVAGGTALAGALLALIALPRKTAEPEVEELSPVLAESGL
jgi:DHA2 family multidrug resistance protein-like MFS transporter